MKYVASLAVAVLAASPALAQDCASEIQTITPGILTVAAYDYPPLSIVSPNGDVTGIDPTIVRTVAEENCLEVVMNVLEPAATIQAVVSGRADVAVGGWNRTEARSEILGLSAPTYLAVMGIFSKEGFDEFSQLEGKPLGTVTGYQWVPDLQRAFGADLKLYPNAISLEQDLLAGRIAAAIDSYIYGLNNQRKSGRYQGVTILLAKPDSRITASQEPAQAGILYTKDNATLGKALDDGIAKMHESGAIEKLITDAGYDPQVANVGEPRLMK